MKLPYDIQIIDTTILPTTDQDALAKCIGTTQLPAYVITMPKRYASDQVAIRCYRDACIRLGAAAIHGPIGRYLYAYAGDTYQRLNLTIRNALLYP